MLYRGFAALGLVSWWLLVLGGGECCVGSLCWRELRLEGYRAWLHVGLCRTKAGGLYPPFINSFFDY